jgi:hypothetical protein
MQKSGKNREHDRFLGKSRNLKKTVCLPQPRRHATGRSGALRESRSPAVNKGQDRHRRPATVMVRDPRVSRRCPDRPDWDRWPALTVLTYWTRLPECKMDVFDNSNPEPKPKDFNIRKWNWEHGLCFLGEKWPSDWYVYNAHVYDTLVYSHQSYLVAVVEEELSVTSLGLRDEVPGMMSGLTSGWIGDPQMVDGPGPRRFRLLT